MRYIIGNWKMNMDLKTITQWYETFSKGKINDPENKKILIAASFVHIPVLKTFPDPRIEIAAQDVSAKNKGAVTGDVGAFQVKEFCKFAIVGHSERKEDIDTVVLKRDQCIDNGITPIVCFKNPDDAKIFWNEKCLIAWEDPSNISQNGVYREKDPAEIQAGVDSIRKHIPSEAVLIYGGSVNRQNATTVFGINGINGVLPGNASLDPQHFLDIINA